MSPPSPSCASCEIANATIDRLLSNIDTFALAAARAELREAREAIERLNRTRPHAMAVEVCRELAEMDPRTNDGPQECFFCCQPEGQHRRDCAWRRAVTAVDQVNRDERRRAG